MRDSKLVKTVRNPSNHREAYVWFDRHDNVYNVELKTVLGKDEEEPEQFDEKDEAIEHAEHWVNERATNVERVVQIMNWARSGPLMQAFVMVALEEYAKQVAEQSAQALDNPMISGAAWKACAVELRDYMKGDK